MFFFFNHPELTEIYTLSLHDALPIFVAAALGIGTIFGSLLGIGWRPRHPMRLAMIAIVIWRSEEHTSELQSLRHLVCRLLLEKKKKNPIRRCDGNGQPIETSSVPASQ